MSSSILKRVVAEEPDVGADVPSVLEPEDVGDQRLLGEQDLRAGPERDRRELDEALAVAVADHPGGPEQVLVDRRVGAVPEEVGMLDVEVALAAEVVELAEDRAVDLVVDGQVVAPLDGAGQAQVEQAEPHVAVDAADLVHGPLSERVGY